MDEPKRGRGRPKRSVPKPEDVADRPELDGSLASIQALQRWAIDAMLTGRIDVKQAETIDKLCRGMTGTRRQEHTETELLEAKQILERMEELQRLAEGRESAARKHMTAPGDPGTKK